MTKAEYYKHVGDLVNRKEYESAIRFVEGELNALDKTGYHNITGKDLLHLIEPAAEFINAFYEKAIKEIEVKAIYCELNGFSINTDMWFVQAFGLSFCGNPDDAEDVSWLADYEYSDEYGLVITGYEEFQKLYEEFLAKKLYHDKSQNAAKEYSEDIVTLRLLELFKHTIQYAKEKNFKWKDVPIFGTSHDCDYLYKSI